MKKQNSNNITSRQLMNFLLSAQVGVELLETPNVLAEKSGHDGWIPIIIVGILIAIAMIFIILLLERYNNNSIYDINKHLYGKYLGGFLNIIVSLYLWAITCLQLRLFTELLKITYLRFTPPIVLDIFIILPTIYLSWYGLKAIARFSFIMWFFILITYILLLLSIRFCDVKLLMPVGESGFLGALKGLEDCYYAYLGFELVVILYPFITDKEKAMKYSLTAHGIGIIFFLSVTLVCTAFFGEKHLAKIVFPLIRLSRAYDDPIVQRIDLLYIAAWIPVMTMSVSSYFFPAYCSVQKLFKREKKTVSLIIFTAITILISRIPRNHHEVYRYTHIITIWGVVFVVFIMLCYIFSFVNKKGVKTSE